MIIVYLKSSGEELETTKVWLGAIVPLSPLSKNTKDFRYFEVRSFRFSNFIHSLFNSLVVRMVFTAI